MPSVNDFFGVGEDLEMKVETYLGLFSKFHRLIGYCD